jgi:hypothetical protein
MSFYHRQWRQCNLQVLCARCQSLKSDLPAAVWFSAVNQAASSGFSVMPSVSHGRGIAKSPAQIRAAIATALVPALSAP